MKLPKHAKEGTNELSKDGFERMALKVIFQGPKGPQKGQIWLFSMFCYSLPIFSKIVFIFCFAYSFLGMILINCQKMNLIQLFERSFSR